MHCRRVRLPMKLSWDIMVRVHRGEITPAEGFRLTAEREATASRYVGDTSEPAPICAYMPYSPTGDLGAEYNRVMARLGLDEWALFIDHDAMMLTNDAWDLLRDAIRRYPNAGAFVCWTNRAGNMRQKAKGAPKGDDLAQHTAYAGELRKRHGTSVTDVTGSEMTGVWFATSSAAWHKVGGFRGGFGGVDNTYAAMLNAAGLATYRLDGLYVYHQRRTSGWKGSTRPESACRKTGWLWQTARGVIEEQATDTLADLYRAHCEAVETRTDWGECAKNARRRVILDAWRGSMQVSVVIPARDEDAAMLSGTVAAFREGGADEVIVVDDASQEPVTDACGATRIIRHPEPRGVAYSRNHGLSEATGNVVVFSDSHCRVAEGNLLDWAFLARCSRDLLVAPTAGMDHPDNWYCGASLAWKGWRFDISANRREVEYPEAPFGSVYAASRAIWNCLGGWVPTRGWGYNEQALALSCAMTGTRIRCLPEFRVLHQFRKRFPYPVSGRMCAANAPWVHRLAFGEDVYKARIEPVTIAAGQDEATRLSAAWAIEDDGVTLAKYAKLRTADMAVLLAMVDARANQ